MKDVLCSECFHYRYTIEGHTCHHPIYDVKSYSNITKKNYITTGVSCDYARHIDHKCGINGNMFTEKLIFIPHKVDTSWWNFIVRKIFKIKDYNEYI